MKKFLVATIFLAFQIAFSQNNSAEIVVLNKDKAPTISKHIYGHFAEHLGRCIYDGIYVGDKSSIANTNGVRNDIIKALQELKVPNLRWPGGCFADTYHWKDGIGPKNLRPTIVNNWWGGNTEDNSFGTHEFLNLAEELSKTNDVTIFCSGRVEIEAKKRSLNTLDFTTKKRWIKFIPVISLKKSLIEQLNQFDIEIGRAHV